MLRGKNSRHCRRVHCLSFYSLLEPQQTRGLAGGPVKSIGKQGGGDKTKNDEQNWASGATS
jgi:hypothetical protein